MFFQETRQFLKKTPAWGCKTPQNCRDITHAVFMGKPCSRHNYFPGDDTWGGLGQMMDMVGMITLLIPCLYNGVFLVCTGILPMMQPCFFHGLFWNLSKNEVVLKRNGRRSMHNAWAKRTQHHGLCIAVPSSTLKLSQLMFQSIGPKLTACTRAPIQLLTCLNVA